MGVLTILVVAVGLAADAFAVSLGAGTSPRVSGPRATFRLAFHFGLFQALMPVAGWLLGSTVEPLIAEWDHWVAFALLASVGARMVFSSLSGSPDRAAADPSRGLTLVALAVGTSIDAFAVGLGLGVLGVSIVVPAAVIGIVTGTLSVVGLRLGRRLGERFGPVVEALGGILLVAIGARILLQHLAL